MSRHILLIVSSVASVLLSSCIAVTTVRDTTKYPNAKGQRYYLPVVYLIGKPNKTGSIEFETFIARDEEKEYAVETWTLLGKYKSTMGYSKTAPGVLSEFTSNASTEAIPEALINAASTVAKANLMERNAKEDAREADIKAAVKNIRAKELAVEQAKLARDAATTAEDKAKTDLALSQAIAALDSAQDELALLTGTKPEMSANKGGAMNSTLQKDAKAAEPTKGLAAVTPIVYRLDDDGKGDIKLTPVPYVEFSRKTGSKGSYPSFDSIGIQPKLPTSELAKVVPDPPVKPFLGMSRDLVKRDKDGAVSQEPIILNTNAEFERCTATLTPVIQGPDPADPLPDNQQPTVTPKDKKHFSLRFQPGTPKGVYDLRLLFVKEKADFTPIQRVTVE